MAQTQVKREERELKHFEDLASNCGYTWWGSQTPASKVRIQRRLSLLKDFFNINNGDKILECGCAAGDFTLSLQEALGENAQIHAIDLSESQIKIAKDKVKKGNVIFKVSSISKIDFNDNFFNLVIGNAILHHLDLDIALAEIKRVLKRNGKLLFFEPNMANPQIWLSLNIKPLRKFYQASPDETAFYKWDIKRRLISNGFRNVIVKPFDFIHPLIPKTFLGVAKKIEAMLEKTFFNEIAGSLVIYAES